MRIRPLKPLKKISRTTGVIKNATGLIPSASCFAALQRLEPKELLPNGRGNGYGDLAGVGDRSSSSGRPGIRNREVRAFLKLKVQRGHWPRDDHKRIGSRDG